MEHPLSTTSSTSTSHTDQPSSLNTDALWLATHTALTAGRWGTARALLDDLARRTDGGLDLLLDVDAYSELAALEGKPRLTGDYRTLFADRIELANQRVLRRI